MHTAWITVALGQEAEIRLLYTINDCFLEQLILAYSRKDDILNTTLNDAQELI